MQIILVYFEKLPHIILHFRNMKISNKISIPGKIFQLLESMWNANMKWMHSLSNTLIWTEIGHFENFIEIR